MAVKMTYKQENLYGKVIRIGKETENNFRMIEFDVTKWRALYPNATISMVYQPPTGTAYSPTVSLSGNTLTWSPTRTDTAYEGAGTGQLILVNSAGDVVGRSDKFSVIVDDGIASGSTPPDTAPSWVEELLDVVDTVGQAAQTATNAMNAAGQSKTLAEQAATEAAASESNVEASALSATGSATTATDASQTAVAAKDTAAQALSDLLALIGTDVCNLVNGQIPVDKIPLSVVYDIVEITDESELISLTAEQVQKKDIAAIIEGTGDAKRCIKSYQLLGDGSPSIRSNWVEVAVTYASTAAFASTSGEAENANTVNGHRIVKFDTYADMISAVKVDDTIYYAPLS